MGFNNKKKVYFFLILRRLKSIYLSTCESYSLCVGDRGQLAGVPSPLPPGGFWGWNSGQLTWMRVLLLSHLADPKSVCFESWLFFGGGDDSFFLDFDLEAEAACVPASLSLAFVLWLPSSSWPNT